MLTAYHFFISASPRLDAFAAQWVDPVAAHFAGNCSTHPSTRKQLIINEILVGQIRRGGSIESGPK
jgi:hypothetical protein